jgi:hypothetical protein
VAGLAGVVLALPLVVLPTHTLVLPTDQSEPSVATRLSFWSWGRIADTTPGAVEPLSFNNPVQLVFFLVSLVICVAACAAFALRRGADGRILGAAGVAWAAAQVLSDLMRGVGDSRSGLWSQGNPRVDLLAGGMLQIASALTLCGALVAIAWRPLLRLGRPVWAWMAGVTRRAAELARHDEREETGPPPRVGIATIREAPATYEQPGWHGSEGVGFSDDPSFERDRFGPPG